MRSQRNRRRPSRLLLGHGRRRHRREAGRAVCSSRCFSFECLPQQLLSLVAVSGWFSYASWQSCIHRRLAEPLQPGDELVV